MNQLASHLMMFMMAAVACRAAVIPNMMFSSAAGRGRHSQHPNQYQQQQQQQHWRPGNLSPWDDGTETYGYLADRHPNAMMDDLTAGFQQQALQPQMQQPLVYGVPHRYLSEPMPNYAMPNAADELYSNALLLRGRAPFNTAIKRSSSFLPYYDPMEDDIVDDSVMAGDDYEQPISRQDVINFEKYVQRFFQKQPSAMSDDESADIDSQYVDDWAMASESMADDGDRSADSEASLNNYDAVDNDEEAARQLHLLLKQQQRRPIALREIRKKSLTPSTTDASTTTPVAQTRTNAPVTTATTTTTMSPLIQRQQQHHQGQKEEPMLRPPTPQRQAQQQPLSGATTAAPTPAKADDAKEDNSIYHTIQRLMNMRDELQMPKALERDSSSAEDESSEKDASAGRAKRFVAPSQESLLNHQIHSLDKIRA